MNAAPEADPPSSYDDFARRITASGVLTDPWFEGRPRFEEAPLVLSPTRAGRLAEAGRAIAEVYDEAMGLAFEAPELLDDFFCLTPIQKAMFTTSRPLWHGIARADVFETTEGLAITELNCDTPTGEAEAVVLGRVAHAGAPHLVDPNEDLESHFVAMVRHLIERRVGVAGPKAAGIVYPTEFTEDLALVRLYRGWLEKAGFEVVLGSPYNLSGTEEDARLRRHHAGRGELSVNVIDSLFRTVSIDPAR